MKSIKFSTEELEILRQQYKQELEEAKKYVISIENLLEKLGVSKQESTEQRTVEKKATRRGRPKKAKTAPAAEKGKRGRKPKVTLPPPIDKLESKPEKSLKTKKKSKSRKGSTPRVKKAGVVPTVEKSLPLPLKTVAPKQKSKKKSIKRKGLVLKNLRKPLPKKDVPPTPTEQVSSTTETEQV